MYYLLIYGVKSETREGCIYDILDGKKYLYTYEFDIDKSTWLKRKEPDGPGSISHTYKSSIDFNKDGTFDIVTQSMAGRYKKFKTLAALEEFMFSEML